MVELKKLIQKSFQCFSADLPGGKVVTQILQCSTARITYLIKKRQVI
jgi:hypothetical protein